MNFRTALTVLKRPSFAYVYTVGRIFPMKIMSGSRCTVKRRQPAAPEVGGKVTRLTWYTCTYECYSFDHVGVEFWME